MNFKTFFFQLSHDWLRIFSSVPPPNPLILSPSAKDGTLILTVSNPASSQPEICVPVSSTALTLPPSSFSSSSSSSSVPSSLHHSPMLVSLPSQLSRAPVPAIITPQIQAQPLSSSGHGQFYSVLDPQPANPALTGSRTPIIQTPALGLLPAAEMASLPATPLRMANTVSLLTDMSSVMKAS